MNAVVSEPLPERALPVPMTPIDMVAFALQSGKDLTTLEKLMDLKDRWEAGEARKAYAKALAAMKATIPIEIFKKKKVDVPGGAKFKHAELADVVDASVAAMGKFGFVHRWITRQDAGLIFVSCVLTHEQGHSESCELFGPPDDSGKKNAIQAIGSTVTYLQRYTLVAALGIAAKNMDDDGNGGKKQAMDGPAAPEGYVNWRTDMTALSDEGMDRLTKAWSESKADYRRYVIKADEDWWNETKAKAVQADRKAKERSQ